MAVGELVSELCGCDEKSNYAGVMKSAHACLVARARAWESNSIVCLTMAGWGEENGDGERED
eukprot:585008-Pleurochrysis_carterae.AAC.1